MTTTTHSARPHVAVVGGGLAGINDAHALAHSDADVTLVDGHNYHTFQPLLHTFDRSHRWRGGVA